MMHGLQLELKVAGILGKLAREDDARDKQQQRRQSRVYCEHPAVKTQRSFLPCAQQRRQRKADQKRRGNGSGGGDPVLPDIGAVQRPL